MPEATGYVNLLGRQVRSLRGMLNAMPVDDGSSVELRRRPSGDVEVLLLQGGTEVHRRTLEPGACDESEGARNAPMVALIALLYLAASSVDFSSTVSP